MVILKYCVGVLSCDYCVFFFFFFFQAEDGIRDIGVTGVQTCALPISTSRGSRVAATVGNANTPTAVGARTAQNGRRPSGGRPSVIRRPGRRTCTVSGDRKSVV